MSTMVRACQTPPPSREELMRMGYRLACTYPGRTEVVLNPDPLNPVMVSVTMLLAEPQYALRVLREGRP